MYSGLGNILILYPYRDIRVYIVLDCHPALHVSVYERLLGSHQQTDSLNNSTAVLPSHRLNKSQKFKLHTDNT